MKNAVITAEYNPFHNGHLRQLNLLRGAGADTVSVIMNGDHVQRGEPALFDKHSRARAAVECGADLVIELPFIYGTGSSEKFATGAVKILNACGVFDTLCFGSENGDTDAFIQAAKYYFAAEKEGLISAEAAKGISYPTAVSNSMRALGAAFIPEKPNDLLAFEYVKALIKTKSHTKPFTHIRRGDYLSAVPESEDEASASAIREMIKNGSDISGYLPKESAEIIRRELNGGKNASYEKFATFVLAELRRKKLFGNAEALKSVSGNREGLINRILAFSGETELNALYMKVKNKRYTYSAVRRAVLYAAYGVPDSEPEPDYIRVLAFNGNGRGLLSQMRDKASLPVFHTLPAIMADSLTVKLEALSSDLYGMYRVKPEPGGNDFRNNSIIIN